MREIGLITSPSFNRVKKLTSVPIKWVPSHLLYIYDEGGGPASNEFVLYRGRRLWDTAVREGIGGPSFPFRQRQAPSLPPAFRSPPWMDTDQEVVIIIFPPPSDDIFQPAKLISPVFFIPLLNKYIEKKSFNSYHSGRVIRPSTSRANRPI